MQGFQRVILVHYHEIGLKGHNRSTFEKRLQKNLEALLREQGLWHVKSADARKREKADADDANAARDACGAVKLIERISGRILVTLCDESNQPFALKVANFIARVPGVARVSAGFKVERDIDAINEAAVLILAASEPFQSFKVKARRAHTDFPIDSMTMNQLVGSCLCENYPDKTVRMKDPDVTVCVEVVQSAAYVYALSMRGIGGLPVGASGKVCCLLSSGIDSPVAQWRMARRGAVCIAVHFSGRPETSDASEYLVRDIAEVLRETGCIRRLYTVAIGSHQREISLYAPPALRVILYRRLMMKVSAAIAEREGAGALVTGESLGQVASQTLDNIRCTDASVDMPVFRPLIGTDKQEIIEQSQELGTYGISTQDAPDCCTLFMPRSPETHAKLANVLEAESKFPVEDWVSELVESAERFDF